MKIQTVGTENMMAVQRSACTLIDDKILIDCGNGIVKTLLEQNICIDDIEALCVTHLHGDHFMDIPFLIMQKYNTTVKGKLNIYGPKGMTACIGQLFTICFPEIKDWTLLKDGGNVTLYEFESLNQKEVAKGYYVTAFSVEHGDCPAFGFLVQNENKTIGLSGDSSYCDAIDMLLEKSSAAIIDTTHIESSNTHMGINDLQKISKKYSDIPIIVTHMYSNLREKAISLKLENVIIPEDGQIIIV